MRRWGPARTTGKVLRTHPHALKNGSEFTSVVPPRFGHLFHCAEQQRPGKRKGPYSFHLHRRLQIPLVDAILLNKDANFSVARGAAVCALHAITDLRLVTANPTAG